uniref:Transport and Golgi organization protein 2 homolog n=1 Tax=Caenorhabditis japonica TaxID=281687 RepID=A0A8R1EFZ4_CAEJA
MCIGFIKVAKTADEKYKLIILNNRDEKLDRPTAEMHWHDGILSGVDEQDEARGTWLGLNRGGKIGMLLSITQPVHTKNQTAPSRGAIVNTFLNTGKSDEFLADLKFHVYSNSPPHIPFKKTEYGCKIFEENLKNSDELDVDQVFDMLLAIATDRTRYGTRSHTLITIDNNDKVTILERRMIAATEVDKSEWIDQKFEFCLDPL